MPIEGPNTILPVPAKRVRLKFPFRVLEKVMVPVPELVEIEVVPVKETALRNDAF